MLKQGKGFFTSRLLRMISQTVFLIIFLFLFVRTENRGSETLGYPVKLFLDFDPLILITTLFSSHAVPAALFISLVTIVFTMLFGRVFCGWVCPLGTLNNAVLSFSRSP